MDTPAYSDADGKTQRKEQATDDNDERSKKNAAGKVQVVRRNHDGDEHQHYSHECGDPARSGQLLVHGPHEHAAPEILRQPGTADENQCRNNQLRQAEDEAFDNLRGQRRVEHAEAGERTTGENHPVDGLADHSCRSQPARRVEHVGHAALTKKLVDREAP
jgi:hypothetical protein